MLLFELVELAAALEALEADAEVTEAEFEEEPVAEAEAEPELALPVAVGADRAVAPEMANCGEKL